MRNTLAGILAALVMVSTASSPGPAAAQDVRVAAGFEKVHRDLRKKEAAALKEIGRADMEARAADALAAQGEKLAAEGVAAIEAQSVAYRAAVARLGAASNAQDAHAEARALADIARGWSEAELRRDRGAQMLREADADRRKASARRAVAVARLDETRLALERTIVRSPEENVAGEANAAPPPPGPGDPPTEASVQPASDAQRQPPKPLDEELLGGAAPLKRD